MALTQPNWEAALESEGLQNYQQKSIGFERSLQQYDAVPDNLQTLLWQTRLFGMTRRTLSGDLQILVEKHWLRRVGQQFDRVSQFPDCPFAEPDSQARLAFLMQLDLAKIADSLSALNGQRRFFVHLEYVVAPQQLDRVDEWQLRRC